MYVASSLVSKIKRLTAVNCSNNKCTCLLLALILGFGFLLLCFGKYRYESDETYVFVNTTRIIFTTDEKFLSFALDTSFMQKTFHHLNNTQWKRLKKLAGLLSPAYLRLGGTAADQVLFKVDKSITHMKVSQKQDSSDTLLAPTDYLIISSEDWIKLHTFVKKARLDFLFDLNVLLRKGANWDSKNAELLMQFSEQNNLKMDFQLGNEPNSFCHVFNVSINARQLGRDFNHLRHILNKSLAFQHSKLIGPDVTRPKGKEELPLNFLRGFLSTSHRNINAASWHQYYLDGRTATLNDFVNPKTLNILSAQIKSIRSVVNEFSTNLPMWISETSSAYGGGAPGLSDRYVASFLWLDKLGVAAKLGMSIVIRQTLFQGHYSLIDSDFFPFPDYWISYFYKKLVGTRVIRVKVEDSREDHLRLYGHCKKLDQTVEINGSVTIFGMNLKNETQRVIVSGMSLRYPIFSYLFTPEDGNLTSKRTIFNPDSIGWTKVCPLNVGFVHADVPSMQYTIEGDRSLYIFGPANVL